MPCSPSQVQRSVMDPALSGAGVPPTAPVVVTLAPAAPVAAAHVVGVPVSQPVVSVPPPTTTSTVRLRLTPGDLSSIATAVAGILQPGQSSRNPLSVAASLPTQAPTTSSGNLYTLCCCRFLPYFS